MKPKEYIVKFGLQRGWHANRQDRFLATLTEEFSALLSSVRDLRDFYNAVKTIRAKWDGVSRKIPYGLPDGMWNYFYATVVARKRAELFPTSEGEEEN